MARFFVDGQNLDDAESRWFVDFAALLPGVGAREVATLRLPGKSTVTTKRLGWSEGSVQVVVDLPPAGSMRGLPVGPVESRVRLLKALLARAQVLTVVEGGVSREVGVVGVSVSDPSRVARDAWRLSVDFTVQPFWSEPNLATSASKTIPGDVVFSEWAGTTGDVMDGLLRVKGPASRVSIVAADGRGVSFERALTASQYVFIDLAGFRAWLGGVDAWQPTATTVLLDYPAAGPLRLTPGVSGVSLAVSGDGLSSASRLVLSGRKWWL